MIKSAQILFLLSFLTFFNCFSQEDSSNKVLEVKVRLTTDLASIHLPAYCGIAAWRMTFDFEIIAVLEGVYSEKSIPINILCPRESVENGWLITGKEYTFRLKPRLGIKEMKLGEPTKEEDLGDFEIVYE